MVIITFILCLLWLLPFALKAKVSRGTYIRMTLAFLAGLVPVSLLAAVFNILLDDQLLPVINMSLIPNGFASAFGTAILEEGFKLLAALLCAAGLKNARKIEYMLIFGAVGAGFNCIETVRSGADPISMVLRTLFAMHVFWLLYDGAAYFEKKNGAAFALLRAYILTVAIHGLNDAGILLVAAEDETGTAQLLGFVLLFITVAVYLVFAVKTIKTEVRSSRRNDRL